MYKNMKSFGRAWVKALRSGEYNQATGILLEEGHESDSFCCLGVAFNLLAEKDPDSYYWEGEMACTPKDRGSGDLEMAGLPPWFEEWLETNRKRNSVLKSTQAHLVSMNDNEGASFAKIASWIEARLPK